MAEMDWVRVRVSLYEGIRDLFVQIRNLYLKLYELV